MVFMLSSGVSATGEGFWITGGRTAGFSGISLSAFLQLQAAAINKKNRGEIIFLIMGWVKLNITEYRTQHTTKQISYTFVLAICIRAGMER